MLSWEHIVKLRDIKIAIIIELEVTIYWSVIHLLPRYDLQFSHLLAIIFSGRVGGGERERGGGREVGRREEPEAFGCVAIIIHNNKPLMLCSILWLMISLIYSQKSPLYTLLETTDPFLPLKTMWSPKFLFLPRTNPRHI